MQLHDLTPSPGSRKKRKKVGRGPGSGMGIAAVEEIIKLMYRHNKIHQREIRAAINVG